MLKVSSPQPQVNQEPTLPDVNTGGIPQMEEPQPNGNEMMNDIPPIENEKPFDNDFDAGVDADEEKEPRKYIEQLAGKLSQKLNDFNQDQEQPDSELCKYVMGMIAAQASKGLSEEDAQEIIKKIENGKEELDNNDMNGEDDLENINEPMNDEPSKSGMEESVNKHNVNEIFQELTQPQTTDSNIELKRKDNSNSFRKRPFIAPNFK